jgi:PAS domain S-box-containing protein
LLTELDVLLEEFSGELKEIKDKYEFLINKKSNELNIEETRTRDLIKKMGEDFYQISTELIDNVKKKKLTEQKLLESEENFRFITENVNDVIIILNKDLKVEYVNELPLNKIAGYHSDDLINKNGMDYIHPDDLAKALNEFTKSLKIGEASIELRLRHKDGQYVWTEAKGNMKIDHEGTLKAHIIVRKISQRKIAEEKLKKSDERLQIINLELEEQVEKRNAKLTESEEKYRQLFENSPNMIVLIDSNGMIIDVNNTFLTKLGDKKDDLIGKDFRNIEGFAIRNLSLFKEKFNKMLIQGNIEPFEIQTYDKDNKLKWVNIQVSWINIGSKKLLQVIIQDIDERKSAEKQLKESEEKYRLITENANDLMVIVNENLEFEWMNEQVHKKLRGFSKKDRIGKPALSFIHPDDLDSAIKIFKKGFEVGEGMGVVRMQNKKGNYDWLEIRGKKFTAKDGKEKALLISRNITKRKLAEQKLKESEEKFRTLFEVAPASIMVADLESNILMCNKKFCRLHGFENPELVKGRKFPEFISKKDRIKLSEGVKMTIEGDSRDIISYTMLKNDGTEFPAEAMSSAIKDKDGNIIGIIGVAQDITKRKKAEQIVKESEEKFRTIAEQSFMGIIILQEEKLKYVNEAAANLFEYSIEDVRNWSKNDMVEKCIYQEDLPILREKRELRRKGEFNLRPYISYRVITKTGKIKWIKQFSRIIDYQGKEAELVSMIDVTDQKEAEKIITEENKKLLELDQIRKELLTRVSHELKTPLVSIFSCSELLIDYYKEQMSEEVFKFVEIIHRGGQRLKDLIKNLLDASQIDAGRLKLNKEKVNLIEIIRNCIDYVKFLVDDRKISLDYDFPEELFIEVDKIRIEQVFTNLLSNALKNTPSNGNICLNITEEDNHIYTIIKDTGVGFTKKEMDKIFKKFGKIERYGKELGVDIEGSGLGLYISKEIVNLHEGMIWVESEGRNKGATFTIKLPTRK